MSNQDMNNFMDNNEFHGYDEDAAVGFIRKKIPANVSEHYSDDDILFVIDAIWEYYDKHGLTSLDDIDAGEDLLDADDLIAYVKKEMAHDKELMMDSKYVELVVKAELDYEKSLEDLF